MKKIFVVLLVCFSSVGAFAQFEQGSKMIGGSLSFSTTTNKSKAGGTTVTGSKSTQFSLAPQVGYFVIDNLAIGAGLELSLYKSKAENNDSEFTSTSVQFEPMVRYYLPQGIFFHGQFGIGGGKDVDKFGTTTDEDKYGVSSLALAVGYAAFIVDKVVAIEPVLGYGTTVYNYKDAQPIAYKSLNPGLFLRVGIQVYLSK